MSDPAAQLEAARAFRRPGPAAPIERFEVRHPAVPERLEGLTILHLSDLHVRGPMLERVWFRRVLDALQATPVDIVALTGDYMDRSQHALAAVRVLEALAGAWRARLGAFGVFGNHDSAPFVKRARRLTGIRWLDQECVDLPARGAETVRLLGAHWPEDLVGATLSAAGGQHEGAQPRAARARDPFTIVLAHMPTALIGAASLNLPLVLAGHTHAGQVRLSPRLAPHTSSDIPAHLAGGMLRLRGSLCCVSRGMGEAILEGLRFNCPRHVPLYTLKRGELPRPPGGASPEWVTQVVPW